MLSIGLELAFRYSRKDLSSVRLHSVMTLRIKIPMRVTNLKDGVGLLAHAEVYTNKIVAGVLFYRIPNKAVKIGVKHKV